MFQLCQGTITTAPDAVLRAMFAARKRVFVDLLDWEHAVYLILTDTAGGHLASARLLPTTRPHLLQLFPQLCADAAPEAADTLEISRFCLDRSLSARDRRAVRNRLVSALVDHALGHGVAAYVAIAEMGWFQQILAFGWHCAPLGVPQEIDGSMIAALRIAIDDTTPSLLAAAGIIAGPDIAGADQRAAA